MLPAMSSIAESDNSRCIEKGNSILRTPRNFSKHAWLVDSAIGDQGELSDRFYIENFDWK